MELEQYPSESNQEIDVKDFKNKFEQIFNKSDLCLILLSLVGEKPAADVEGVFKDEKKLDKVIEVLVSSGFNCYVNREPEVTDIESLIDIKKHFNEDPIDLENKLVEAETIARLFITKRDYSKKYLKPITTKKYDSKFHRRYGNFLEFPDRDIEAFIYKQLPLYRKLFYRIRTGKPPKALTPAEAFEKYGGKDQSEKTFRTFINRRIADTTKSFNNAYLEAENRENKIKESKLDLKYFYDNLEV